MLASGFPSRAREIRLIMFVNQQSAIVFKDLSTVSVFNFVVSDMGKESSASLEGLTSEQVAEAISKLNA